MKVLVTCPPMLGMIDSFRPLFAEYGMELTAPNVVQTFSVDELVEIVPKHDGWIIGDDPATREVFTAGKAGNLKAAIKWGIGVDNVDFEACKELDIPIVNTPGMFGSEVADIAMGYIIALARETFQIHEGVREGKWPKPRGISLSGKKVGLVGFGDIGKSLARRMFASEMDVIVYDPGIKDVSDVPGASHAPWPERLDEVDFIAITCALTKSSKYMLNDESLGRVKKGVRVVNVGRGPVIKEAALERALQDETVYSAALDVFEVEPLPEDSYLRQHPRCVFGSHNASNAADAVNKTSVKAIDQLADFLGIQKT